jgi:4-hydroxybenzoate polyprenyltransferase
MVVFLWAGSGLLAFALPIEFALALAIYVVLSISYSLVLKRRLALDVIVLAILYTLRVIAGAVLVQVSLSSWFLGFSIFLFFSLAIVKRVIELEGENGDRILSGRRYLAADIPILLALGSAGALASDLVYCLYITGDDVLMQYTHPERLWAGLPLLLYWQARLWLLAGRQVMHYDPVVFALQDRTSRLVFVAFMLVVVLAV